jgi:hypothetical protein
MAFKWNNKCFIFFRKSLNQFNIKHYIGELYFLRAYRYFTMLQLWGDFPIVEEVLSDNETTLAAANTRRPRNEVARFVLKDLDTAIEYMADNFSARRTRISKDVAYLFKSRVALFEGPWLTNFKNSHLYRMAKAGRVKPKIITPIINFRREASKTKPNFSLMKL